MRFLILALILSGGLAAQFSPPVSSPAYGTTAESFGASPTATGATNVTAINAALATGGLVTLDTCGTYTINASLVISSNTTLRSAPCVKYFLANTTNLSLIVNSGYNTFATTASVTLSAPTGISVPVAWTAHGLVVGDYVLIAGAVPSNYNGVFKVSSVTDANNFVYEMDRLTTTSPTGTQVAKKCDVNITIDGGVWDGNYLNNAGSGTPGSFAMIFGAAQNVVVKNIVGQNSKKYVICFGAIRDYSTENVTMPTTPSDGIKVFGPAYNGSVRNMSGQFGDDAISVQTKVPVAFASEGWTLGDIINFRVDGVDNNHTIAGGGNGFVAYPSVTEYMGGITVRGLGGQTPNASACNVQWAFASALLNDLACDGVNGAAVYVFAAYSNTGSGTIANLRLSNFTITPALLANQPPIQIDSNTTVGNWSIEHLVLNTAAYSSASPAYLITINGTVDLISIHDCAIRASTSTTRFILMPSAAVVTKGVIDSCTQANAANAFVVFNAGSTAGHWTLSNSDLVCFSAFQPSVNVTVVVTGNRFSGMTGGVLRTVGSITINGTFGGNIYAAASVRAVSTSGTPVFNLWDQDPTAGLIDFGTHPAVTGCGTTATWTGGQTAGTFAIPVGTTSCTAVITLPTSNGNAAKWACRFNDLTTPADLIVQASTTSNSCTSSTAVVVAGDVIQFVAVPY